MVTSFSQWLVTHWSANFFCENSAANIVSLALRSKVDPGTQNAAAV